MPGVLLVIYLCDKWFSWRKRWSDWRKKRRRHPAPAVEENAPLNNWGKSSSDPENGVAEESKISNSGGGKVFVVRSLITGLHEILLTVNPIGSIGAASSQQSKRNLLIWGEFCVKPPKLRQTFR